jgi:beta-phosphoglucomutase-like phosphatase (HAD superfamily)
MKSVLFDLDGTIADTEILKAKALALALAVRKFGGSPSPDLYKRVMGQSWEVVTGAFFSDSKIAPAPDQFNPIFREFYSQLIETELTETKSIVPFLHSLKFKIPTPNTISRFPTRIYPH